MVFSVNYFCRFRQLFLPVHPLFLTALLGHSGAVAGHVEFQDDRVVDHPVSRAFAKRPTGRRTWSGRPATARRPRALPPASATPRLTTPAGPTVKAGPLSRPGRRRPRLSVHARFTTGRRPLPRPPGGGRQGHGHHRAGPGSHLPLTRRRRHAEE